MSIDDRCLHYFWCIGASNIATTIFAHRTLRCQLGEGEGAGSAAVRASGEGEGAGSRELKKVKLNILANVL